MGTGGATTSGTQTTTTSGGSGGSASYVKLPTLGGKGAPREFTGKGRRLERFLNHYKHLCAQCNVTADDQKCEGLLTYCDSGVVDLLENLDEYIQKDFTGLVERMRWLFDSDSKKGEYHTGHIDDFTKEWRKEQIPDLRTFKEYHRDYLKLAGPLKTAGYIDEKVFNRGFWAGLNEETRDRIERRMTDDEPGLDLTTPFPVDKVVRAAEHIFNRNRFDKHLREKSKFSIRRFRERSSERRRKSHRKKKEESESESDSGSGSDEESDEEPPKRWRKSKEEEKSKVIESASKKVKVSTERAEADEVGKLVDRLGKLTIHDTQYRTDYVRLCMLAPRISEYYPEPPKPRAQSFQATRFQTPNDARPPPAEPFRRDPPPHQAFQLTDPRTGDRREYTCYGCGGKGHRMDQCAKLEAFINQGHVRRIMGKLRWHDGSNIFREPEETWGDAIMKRVQRENLSRTTEEQPRQGSYLIEVHRDDSDAETDVQEEFGWQSGAATVSDLQAYGADRPNRVSREARIEKGANLHKRPQRMKEFAPRRNNEGANGKEGPVAKDANLYRNKDRSRTATTPTPYDVSKEKFEGVLDSEFVPMDVEKVVTGELVDDGGKLLLRDPERGSRKVVQGRAKKGRAQSEVVHGILDLPLTLRLQDIASISPIVRRDLVGTLKAMRDDPSEDIGNAPRGEQKPLEEERGKTRVLRTEEARRRTRDEDERNEGVREARAELLKIEATVGDAVMMGIVDSGSMVNMISARMLEESGLPSVPLREKAFRVTGVNGRTSRCKSWIPKAKILLTKKRVVTEGDLYVLEDADFELILGRPWATLNGVNIEEKVRGTFVSWTSGNERYEINASRTTRPPVQVEEDDVEVNRAEQEDDDEWEDTMTALTVRVRSQGTDRSYVPNSEISRAGPDYLEEQEVSEDAEEVDEANRKAQERVKGWRREQEGDADDEAEIGEEEDEGERAPPPNQLGQAKDKARERDDGPGERPGKPTKRKRVSQAPRHQIVVDKDLEEGFSRMIQFNANDNEWERFLGKERRRLAKRDQDWLDWIEKESDDEEKEYEAEADNSSERNYPNKPDIPLAGPQTPPREPSHTLETHPKSPIQPAKKRRILKEWPMSTEVTARRSRRIRRATTCSTCGGAPMDQSRAYQKRERATRTVARWKKMTEGAVPSRKEEPQVFSLCLRVKMDEPDELETGERGEATRRRPPSKPQRANRQVKTHQTPPETSHERPLSPRRLFITRPGALESEQEPCSTGNAEGKRPRGPRRQRPQLAPILIPEIPFIAEIEGPVIPDEPIDPGKNEGDEGDSDGLSIIEPVAGAFSDCDPEGKGGPTAKGHARTRKPRPDSEIRPYWIDNQEPEAKKGNSGMMQDTRVRTRRMEIFDLGTKSGMRNAGQSRRKYEPNTREAAITEHRLKTAPRPNPPRTTLEDSITYPWVKLVPETQDKTSAPTHQKEEDPPRRTLKRTKKYPDLRRAASEVQQKQGDLDLTTSEGGRRPQERDGPKTVKRKTGRQLTLRTFLARVPAQQNLVFEEPKSIYTKNKVGPPIWPSEEVDAPRRAEKKSKTFDTLWDTTSEGTQDERDGVRKPGIATSEREKGNDPSSEGVRSRKEVAGYSEGSGGHGRVGAGEITQERKRGRKKKVEEINENGIKAEKKTRRLTCLQLWRRKSLRLWRKIQPTLLTLTPLLLLPLLALFILYLIDPRRRHHLTMTNRVSPAPDVRSSIESRPHGRRYASYDAQTTNHGYQVRDQGHQMEADVAKSVLDNIPVPLVSEETPGIIGVRHLVQWKDGTSPRVQEYLGRGTSVSTRLANGRTVHHRGDVHIRIFERGTENGWDDAEPPSRTELDHLRGILFREEGYRGVMTRIKEGSRKRENTPMSERGVPPFSLEDQTLTEGELADLKRELRRWRWKYGDEVGEALPESSNEVVKIGPPRGKKGKSAQLVTPLATLPEEGPEEDFVKVKVEEDEDLPFKLGILFKPGVSAVSEGDKSTSGDSQVRFSDSSSERAIPPTSDDGQIRDQAEILADLVDTLKTLKLELAKSLDSETEKMIQTVEGNAEELKKLREKGEETKDRDGDVEMKKERTEGNSPAPAYRPTSPAPGGETVDPYAPKSPVEIKLEDIAERLQRMEEGVREMEWKMAGEESKTGERMALTEVRVTALETRQNEGGPTRRSPRRGEAASQVVTRGKARELEGKVGKLGHDIRALQAQFEELLPLASGWEATKEWVKALEERIAGAEGEIAAGAQRTVGLATKWEENRLRQEITNRQITAVLPRMTKSEDRLLEAEYRLATSEEQMIWTDQKLRAIWMFIHAPSVDEARLRAASIRTIWSAAAEAYNRRIDGLPLAGPRPRLEQDEPPTQSRSRTFTQPPANRLAPL